MTAMAYLGLGSNLGERRTYLEQALAALDREPGICVAGGSGRWITH